MSNANFFCFVCHSRAGGNPENSSIENIKIYCIYHKKENASCFIMIKLYLGIQRFTSEKTGFPHTLGMTTGNRCGKVGATRACFCDMISR